MQHFGFIAASYAVAAVVVGGLTAWVMLDYRALRRRLTELDRKGVARRAAPPARPKPAAAPAKEGA